VKVIMIFGTRPEAIKMVPVFRELQKHQIETKICITAQHRSMLDQVLTFFNVKPDYDLNLMQKNQTLFDITINALKALEEVLKQENPDIVLVQGDTTTTFVGSLAAFYLKIKVGHIEAGLRTWDKLNPFPEENNRRLTDILSDIHFAPTEFARKNLLNEGFSEKSIFVTGNTGIDALFMTLKQINESGDQSFSRNLNFNSEKLILVTCHRRESFGDSLENICIALKRIVNENKYVEIVYPVHLNPNIRNTVNKHLIGTDRIHLIEPLDYASFVWLMNKSYIILTDSGGVQEEAPSLGKPVLVLRERTERQEAINAGTAKLVGTKSESIFHETQKLLQNIDEYKNMSQVINPYGDGQAAVRIVDILSRVMPEI